MADDSEVLEQLTKLRLKVLKEKIAAEKQKASGSLQSSGFSEISTMFTGTSTDPHVMLQAEILKSEQLLQNVKEERLFLQGRSKKNKVTEENRNLGNRVDMNAEMVSMMLAQSVQLQQMMINQMITSDSPHRSTEPTKNEPSHHQVEFQPVGYREMDPFTTLPQTTLTQKVKPFQKERKKSLHPQPMPKVPMRTSLSRALAMPVRSTELLREPKPRPKTSSIVATGFLNEPSSHDQVNEDYPFPGTKRIRKLRQVFYAAWFCFMLLSLLKKLIKRRYEDVQRLDDYIHSGISELHEKFYLNQDNSICMALNHLTKEGCLDVNIKSPGIFQKLSENQQAALTELSTIVETIIYSITEIRLMSGLLSPSREGVLWYMLQTGVYLPASYLWEVEKVVPISLNAILELY